MMTARWVLAVFRECHIWPALQLYLALSPHRTVQLALERYFGLSSAELSKDLNAFNLTRCPSSPLGSDNLAERPTALGTFGPRLPCDSPANLFRLWHSSCELPVVLLIHSRRQASLSVGLRELDTLQ
ncbi:hypothetical protein DFH06DRAFT_345571 [Mycena polygramma]|nr:hypothetical protein DFH06DRAFT_345571 [Mycena polygramma]